MTDLGYSRVRPRRNTSAPAAEIARMNPVRGSLAYGQTVLHGDLGRADCHERLLYFSQRRTRRRSSILFFVGIDEADEEALEELLQRLEIRSRKRGGHVHVVPIPPAAASSKKASRKKAD